MNGKMDVNHDKSQGDVAAVLKLLGYGRKHRKALYSSIFWILLSSFFVMLSAMMLGLLAEKLSSSSMEDMLTLSGLIIAFELASLILTYLGRVGLLEATNNIVFEVRSHLFTKLTTIPIAYFDKEPLGRTLTRVTSDVEEIEDFFSSTLARAISAMLIVVGVVIAMLVTNLQFGLIVIGSSLPALTVSIFFRGVVQKRLRRVKTRKAEIDSTLAEFISGIRVIRLFNLEGWSIERFQKIGRRLLESYLSFMNLNSCLRPLNGLFCVLPLLVILWYGGHQFLNGAMPLSILVAFVRFAERFQRPVFAISHELHIIQEAITASERVLHLLEQEDEVSTLGPIEGLKNDFAGHVTFDDVWMQYKPSKPVLKGISFEASKGHKIGLVGATGSGKSSTVSLISQLYPVMSGRILLDNRPLKHWDRRWVRNNLGVVGQDTVMIHGTLRQNLTITAKENLDDEQILSFCDQTGLTDVIDSCGMGLDYHIVENGDNLSAGEKQLIAYTRMLIRDPAILILDEATAAVDREYELKIQQATELLLKERTCFIIAHRLKTVEACDQILVFKEGNIIEQGRHETLISQQGYYANLARSQTVL